MRMKKLADSQLRKLLFQSGLSAKLLKWKWFFILVQIKLIVKIKAVHLVSFWK